MQIRDIMTEDPICAQATATVTEVVELMADREIRHVPVIQGGELVGMVSDRDLRHISWAALLEDEGGGKRRLKLPISNFMSGDVLSVGPEDDVTDAIDIMLEHKVGSVPVVDEADGAVVGIVSYMDILKHARDLL